MLLLNKQFNTRNQIWDKAFKSGLSKFCGRQPLRNPFKFFKGCLPQNLLRPLLNTLPHMRYSSVTYESMMNTIQSISLDIHCVKSVQIWSFYGVNLCIQSEYRKIWTRENSVFGHFSRSDPEETHFQNFRSCDHLIWSTQYDWKHSIKIFLKNLWKCVSFPKQLNSIF